MAQTASTSLLVADDDPYVQATYKFCFEEAGFNVGVANDGNEVIAYLKRHKVDAVLLDIFMPKKDGFETLLDIKKQFPNVCVIVMTGGGTDPSIDYLAMASQLGADRAVEKPASPQDLVRMVQASPCCSTGGATGCTRSP